MSAVCPVSIDGLVHSKRCCSVVGAVDVPSPAKSPPAAAEAASPSNLPLGESAAPADPDDIGAAAPPPPPFLPGPLSGPPATMIEQNLSVCSLVPADHWNLSFRLRGTLQVGGGTGAVHARGGA